MPRKKSPYKKPKITHKKIRLNYFLSTIQPFTNIEDVLIPNVFASWCGC